MKLLHDMTVTSVRPVMATAPALELNFADQTCRDGGELRPLTEVLGSSAPARRSGSMPRASSPKPLSRCCG